MNRSIWLAMGLLAVSAPSMSVAGQSVPTELPARARGAERVVVGAIEHVQPTYDVNEIGDT